MRQGLTAAFAVLSLALAATPATAQEPTAPYDGSNPFNCEIQDVGTGTDFPHPEADPFCVEFDKTNQNVTDFGLVDFLSQEPARTSDAVAKCFYFQRDHWTGSVIQGQEPELWHWDGGYWFDKAQAQGGVSVRNFRIAGQPASAKPFAPPGYGAYFDENGGGGVETALSTQAEPDCVAMVDTPQERAKIYAGQPRERSCIEPGGRLRGRRVGRIHLGMRRGAVIARLGEPGSRRSGVDSWCVIGDARLRASYAHGARPARQDGPSGPKLALIRTTSAGHALGGVRTGDPLRRAKAKLQLTQSFRVHGARALEAPTRKGRRAFLGIRRHRVRWIALTDPRLLSGDRATARALRRAG